MQQMSSLLKSVKYSDNALVMDSKVLILNKRHCKKVQDIVQYKCTTNI